jgi:hypothetical protein
MPQYKVVAPLVQLKVTDATGALLNQHFYAGALVPENVDPESLRAHLDGDLVVEAGAPEAALGTPAGTPVPGRPPNVPVSESAVTGQPLPPFSDHLVDKVKDLPAEDFGDDVPDVDEPAAAEEFRGEPTRFEQAEMTADQSGKPRGNASEAAWREYHVAHVPRRASRLLQVAVSAWRPSSSRSNSPRCSGGRCRPAASSRRKNSPRRG